MRLCIDDPWNTFQGCFLHKAGRLFLETWHIGTLDEMKEVSNLGEYRTYCQGLYCISFKAVITGTVLVLTVSYETDIFPIYGQRVDSCVYPECVLLLSSIITCDFM